MKIQGPGRAGSTKGTSKAGSGKKTGDASFDSLISEESSVESAIGTSGAASVNALGALVTLQEVGDATGEARRKAKKRAGIILDQLEDIKRALLTGDVSREMLENLARTVKAQKETVDDPLLVEIINEIDMRAQIELAKYDNK